MVGGPLKKTFDLLVGSGEIRNGGIARHVRFMSCFLTALSIVYIILLLAGKLLDVDSPKDLTDYSEVCYDTKGVVGALGGYIAFQLFSGVLGMGLVFTLHGVLERKAFGPTYITLGYLAAVCSVISVILTWVYLGLTASQLVSGINDNEVDNPDNYNCKKAGTFDWIIQSITTIMRLSYAASLYMGVGVGRHAMKDEEVRQQVLAAGFKGVPKDASKSAKDVDAA